MSTEKMKAKITLHVNGRKHTVNVDPSMPLLYVLRNYLELNGPKYGCGQELCSSCMVLIDNKALPSCRLPVDRLQNKAITTLEGLVRKDGKLHPVQQAFVDLTQWRLVNGPDFGGEQVG